MKFSVLNKIQRRMDKGNKHLEFYWRIKDFLSVLLSVTGSSNF
jgi:hypothetical protein